MFEPKQFEIDGYCVSRKVFDDPQLELLRAEADRVARDSGRACVRHLRDRSKVFRELSNSLSFLLEVPLKGLKPVRAILFDKTCEGNWPVPWHQDLTIAVRERRTVEGYGPWSVKGGVTHVQPPVGVLEGMITVRLHLDETRRTNGALRLIPGSHLLGRLDSARISALAGSSVTICECASGDVLLMSPLILHSSARSELPNRRRILHFEFARLKDLSDRLRWHES